MQTLVLGLLGIPLSRTRPRQGRYSRFGRAALIADPHGALFGIAKMAEEPSATA